MNRLPNLSELERRVMDFIWRRSSVTASEVRSGLEPKDRLADSTVRTVLRRLEEKGYLTHRLDGRAYRYEPTADRRRVAVQAVRRIIDRFCEGSVEQLLLGLVENEVIDERELGEAARKIAAAERERKRKSPEGEES